MAVLRKALNVSISDLSPGLPEGRGFPEKVTAHEYFPDAGSQTFSNLSTASDEHMFVWVSWICVNMTALCQRPLPHDLHTGAGEIIHVGCASRWNGFGSYHGISGY